MKNIFGLSSKRSVNLVHKMVVSAFIVLCLSACAKSKLSSQEIRRQQEISEADALKAEYAQVVGQYHGDLVNSKTDAIIPVVLTLVLQDVPVDGSAADPVLTPKLLGSLRVILGSMDMGEYLDAEIKNSEYLSTTKILNMSAHHEQTGTITLNLAFDGKSLSGNWTAPTSGTSGTTNLLKK